MGHWFSLICEWMAVIATHTLWPGLELSWEKMPPNTRWCLPMEWTWDPPATNTIQMRRGGFLGPSRKKFVYAACREYISTSANARFCYVHKFIYNTGWVGQAGSGMGAVHDDIPIKSSAVFVLHVFLRWKENDDTTTTVLARSERIDRIKVDWTDRGRDDSIGTQTQDGGEKGYIVISIPDGW